MSTPWTMLRRCRRGFRRANCHWRRWGYRGTHKNNNKTNILSQFKQREDSNINLVPKAKSTHKFSIGLCPRAS
ncbi:hypothetical protein AAHA92_17350 [Salvia divinorum]|uniref:Ribosomal protein L2 n=1 Tax=Salvia divinorum TaxID=28513 RepID=A0ABD1H1Y8_SALDI